MIDARRQRPTTQPTGHEDEAAYGGPTSTRIREGTSAAAGSRRPLMPRLTAYGPPLTEAQLVAGYRNAVRTEGGR